MNYKVLVLLLCFVISACNNNKEEEHYNPDLPPKYLSLVNEVEALIQEYSSHKTVRLKNKIKSLEEDILSEYPDFVSSKDTPKEGLSGY